MNDIYDKSNLYIKFCFDKCFSIIFLILLSPVFLLIAINILIEGYIIPATKGPIFITQERISANEPFLLIKFRTFFLQDDPLLDSIADTVWFINNRRLTYTGKILRKFYLDELPQLINIAQGKMSFVGPRPWPQKQYQDAIEKGNLSKKLLRGGLCGPTQSAKNIKSKGKSEMELENDLITDYKKRTALQVLLLDLKYILSALQVVLQAKGL